MGLERHMSGPSLKQGETEANGSKYQTFNTNIICRATVVIADRDADGGAKLEKEFTRHGWAFQMSNFVTAADFL